MKYLFSITTILLLITGCTSSQIPEYRPVKKAPTPAPTPVQKVKAAPVKPTKVHTLKEVQDNNFNPDYMYPETPKKKTKEEAVSKQPVTTPATISTAPMGKEECIAMIGQEKFDKYTQMLGGESGAIKRCTMLKAMQ